MKSSISKAINQWDISMNFFQNKTRWLRNLALIILLISLINLSGYSCSIRKLPSDQEMIDYFNLHKNDFNQLVKIYGEYSSLGNPGRGSSNFLARPDVAGLMLKAGIGSVGGGVGGYWFDEPYSEESARKLDAVYESEKNTGNIGSNYRRIAIAKMEDANKYTAVYFFSGGLNWKDYVYIPVDPEILQGRVRFPRRLTTGEKPHLWWRVLDSLDSPEWGRGECVLRKIEPKWFLRRCRAN
ncbi:hypothetical protein ABE501_19300 [Comamonas testosteroni]